MSALSSFEPLVFSLSDTTFDLSKQLLAALSFDVGNATKSPALVQALSLLFSSNRIDSISRSEFSDLLSAIFYKELGSKFWVMDYLCSVYMQIGDGRPDKKAYGQAKQYLDFILGIRDKYKKAPNTSFSEKELADLTDFTKYALILDHAYELCGNNMPQALNFNLQTDWVVDMGASLLEVRSADDRALLIRNAKAALPGAAGAVAASALPALVGVPVAAKAFSQTISSLKKVPSMNENKLFHLILLWLLYFRICEEDSVLHGGND